MSDNPAEQKYRKYVRGIFENPGSGLPVTADECVDSLIALIDERIGLAGAPRGDIVYIMNAKGHKAKWVWKNQGDWYQAIALDGDPDAPKDWRDGDSLCGDAETMMAIKAEADNASIKSLGQVAYEARKLFTPWASLAMSIQDSYQAAAKAVVKANNERSVSTGPAIEAISRRADELENLQKKAVKIVEERIAKEARLRSEDKT